MKLIYLSPVAATSYPQRPHYLVECWQRHGAREVAWIEPYPCRLPQWTDIRWPRQPVDQGTLLLPSVRVFRFPAFPIEPLPGGTWLNRWLCWVKPLRLLRRWVAQDDLIVGIGRPSALAMTILAEFPLAASFYDAMDDFPEFHRGLSRRSVRRYERQIAAEVDLVIASSTFLAEKFAGGPAPVVKLLNAYPMRSLPPWRPSAPASASGPVLGYIGCLGQWFDWPLVVRLAQAMPAGRIELVGPRAVPPPGNLPSNVRLWPACGHLEAVSHLRRFSAGLIPFQKNALTAGVDPIKFYEYRAFGLPVLSTTFGEMARRSRADGVYFLDGADDLKSVVSAALAHRDSEAAVARFRQLHDWEQRFSEADALQLLLSSRTIPFFSTLSLRADREAAA
jgi:glycosyltransferase involved in cell wall biosynthesis